MKRTRLSLYYVAAYLLSGGAGFLFAPDLSLRLFLSTGHYSEVMVRFAGVLLLALGILVVQIVRHRAERLYATTLVVRTIILAALASFYGSTGDPLMLVLLGIVGTGFLITLTCYRLDLRRG